MDYWIHSHTQIHHTFQPWEGIEWNRPHAYLYGQMAKCESRINWGSLSWYTHTHTHMCKIFSIRFSCNQKEDRRKAKMRLVRTITHYFLYKIWERREKKRKTSIVLSLCLLFWRWNIIQWEGNRKKEEKKPSHMWVAHHQQITILIRCRRRLRHSLFLFHSFFGHTVCSLCDKRKRCSCAIIILNNNWWWTSLSFVFVISFIAKQQNNDFFLCHFCGSTSQKRHRKKRQQMIITT